MEQDGASPAKKHHREQRHEAQSLCQRVATTYEEAEEQRVPQARVVHHSLMVGRRGREAVKIRAGVIVDGLVPVVHVRVPLGRRKQPEQGPPAPHDRSLHGGRGSRGGGWTDRGPLRDGPLEQHLPGRRVPCIPPRSGLLALDMVVLSWRQLADLDHLARRPFARSMHDDGAVAAEVE